MKKLGILFGALGNRINNANIKDSEIDLSETVYIHEKYLNHLENFLLIKVNEELNPEYLKSILNIYHKIGIFFNICTNWNNQSGVNIGLLRTVKIPIPSLSIQTKIAQKVKFYREQSQRLKKEADNNLQKAKEKVEKIILG